MRSPSRYPPRDVRAVSDALRARAAATPHRDALLFLRDGETDELRITYSELDRKARAHATVLAEAAPKPDADGPARVVLLHPPGIDFVAAFFGVLYAGLVPVPAYVPRAGRGVQRLVGILEDARASILAMPPSLSLKATNDVFAKLPRVGPPPIDEEASLAALWRERDADPEACALLQYTSGSTSSPKGVVLRHRNLTANTAAIATAFGTSSDASFGVIWLPPFHDMGLIGGILHPIVTGFPVALFSPMEFLQRPARWLMAIDRYKATISGGPNFAYDLAARRLSSEQREALDLRSWTTAFCGAEPIRAATLARFAEAFRPSGFRASAFVPCYGLAEATLLVTGTRRSDPPRIDDSGRRVVGCGPPAEGTRIAVVDGRGSSAPEGVEGEIWVAGPGVADGYFRAADAARETFGARLPGDPTTYLRTGDLGYVKSGELFVTGRLKELIIVRGRNVHPRDIEEEAQSSHPALRAHGGAAFATDHRVVLVQELERGARANLAAVAEAIQAAVSSALDVVLDAIVLVRAGTVPVTSSGKIQRAACRDAYESRAFEVLHETGLDVAGDALSVPTIAAASPVATEPASLEARVASILRVDAARLTPDRPLTALGLDSLAAVEVQSFARAAGARVSLDELLSGLTWGALARRIDEARAAPAPVASVEAPRDTAPSSSHVGERASYVEAAAVARTHARPDSSALNVAVAGWLEGTIDRPAFVAALAALEARHDALRTSFTVGPTGVVERHVSASCRGELDVIASTEEELAQRLAHRAWAPFDIAAAPLFRVVLAEVSGRLALLFAAHHAIVDLASLEILLRDLGALYAEALGDRAAIYPPRAQASDAARMERSFVELEGESCARRWEERLPHPLPVLDVPRTGASRRTSPRTSSLIRIEPSAATVAGVRDLARATNSSTFTVLLAAYYLVLHHWSGQREIVVGCEAAGRARAELMDVVGSFARPLPVHAKLDPLGTFTALVSALRGALVGALEDQAYPFLAIVDRLARRGATFDPDAPPVFQAVFNFTRGGGDDGLAAVALGKSGGAITAGALQLRTIGLVPRHAHSEIALLAAARGAAATQGDGIDLALLHDADLYERSSMDQLAADLSQLLARAVTAPGESVARLLGALPRRRVPVRIAANFTATPIVPALEHWLRLAGLPPLVVPSPYDGLLTALHDGSLRGAGANVLLVRPEALARGAAADGALERNLALLIDALAAFGASPCPPTVLAITPPEGASPPRLAARRSLLAWAREQPWLSVLDLEEVARRFEVRESFDREALSLGDAPLSDELAAATGTAVARALRAELAPPRKVVVVDADGTLWGGVAAEDGPLGVRVDGPHAELQRRLVRLHDAGFLLALVSKNVESDVVAVFEAHPEMPLGRRHLVALRATWRPKPEIVRALATTLDLGLDAFVFIDDSPVECGAMRAACPEVLVVELPASEAGIVRRLDAVWELDPPRASRTTPEDRARSRMYRDTAMRANARAESGSLAAFLASLELVVDIGPLAPSDVPRVAQLTQRTNQLNTTTRRMTEAEVAGLRDAWTVRVRDRFGDYGLVGLVVLEESASTLDVPALLLSCRALGRGVEARIVTWLAAVAEARGATEIALAFAKTARNEPARRMLEAVGGAPIDGDVARAVFAPGDASEVAARVAPSEASNVPAAEATDDDVRRAGSTGSRLLEASIARDRAATILAALTSPRVRRRPEGRPLRGVEVEVAEAWSAVLGVTGIGPEDDFFALGGTSLHALAAAARLRRSIGAQLDVATMFAHPRLASLADAIARPTPRPEAITRDREPGEPADPDEPVPATSMQRRLWLLHRLDPLDPAYHVPFAARIVGPVDPAAWATAFAALVTRHEALRLRFVARDDEPCLALGDGADAALELTSIPRDVQNGWLTERIEAPFDLERGPLVRASLATIEQSDEHVFLMVVHHAVADGASLVTLVRELADALRGEAATEPAPSWRAYARDEAARDPGPGRVALEACKATLAGIEPLEIPIAGPLRADAARGAVAVRYLPGPNAAAVRALAKDLGTTAFTVLGAAYAGLLGRLAGRGDVALGIPVSLRDDARWQDLVGPLVNTVVARVPVPRAVNALALVANAHAAMRAAYASASLPFETLVSAIVPERDPTRSPLIQALIVEQPSVSAVMPAAQAPGAPRIEPLAVNSGGAQLDLSLAVSHEADGAIRLALEFRRDRVSAEGAGAFLERLTMWLTAMTERPDRSDLPLVTDAERHRLLSTWAGPARAYATNEGLARAFERQVDRTPDAPAVTGIDGALTYAELDRAANRLAHALTARGVGRGVRVGIALRRSCALVATIHACLKIGAPYVPLEPDLPRARLAFMAEDAGVAAVACEPDDALWGARSLVAAREMTNPRRSAARPDVDVRGSDLAYVLYTSGSTGQPKGVMVEHAGVQNRLFYQEESFALEVGETVLHKTPFGFDVSVWELLWPLRVGGHLVVAPPGAHRDPDAIVDLVARHGIKVIHFVPSMLGAFVEAEGLERRTSLEHVFASGEALPSDVVARLRERLPRVAIHNFYGPTEASIEVTRFTVPEGPVRAIPIGAPIANCRMYVVDERGSLLPPGAVGELWISGVQVARGYLGDEARTRAAFGDDPFVEGARVYRTGDLGRYREDGAIEYLGRKDLQVKIRGQRVELGEVESALREHPSVTATVITLRGGRLVAYVVGEATAEELRAHLASRLPEAMVPSAFVPLPELPIGATGKIARDRLPEPPPDVSTADVAPATSTEQVLAEIWSSVLGARDIGRDADFFSLGGDSILALKVVSRARARGLALAARDVFERPTLRALAARAAPRGAAAPTHGAEAVEAGERAPLLPMQRAFFARHPPSVQDRYGQSIHVAREGLIDVETLARSFDVLARRHPALATRFERAGERVVAQRRPEAEPRNVAVVRAASPGEDPHQLAASAIRVGGPLVAATVMGNDAVIVAHHAVVDAVSWHVLADELAHTYARIARGEAPDPAPADATFSWARALDAWARSEDGRAERTNWEARFAHLPDGAFGSGLDGLAGCAGDEEVLVERLDRATTAGLLGVLRATFAEIDVALAGAVATAIARARPRAEAIDAVVLDVERSGRDRAIAGAADLDLPRAVGWLTALFPVAIRPGRARDPRALLDRAREAFGAAPNGGVGFGALDVALPSREVVINYVGVLSGRDDASGLRVASTGGRADRDRAGPRDHVLEVVAGLDDGELVLRFGYPRSEANASLTAQIATEVVGALAQLAALGPGGAYEDVHELAPTQGGILLESLRSDAGGTYVEQLAIDVTGPVDEARLRAAWEVVVARHGALRSAFRGNFVVVERADVVLERGLFETGSIAPGDAALDDWLRADRLRGFDPARAPLLRVTLLDRGARTTRTMVLTHHHAIADGWCVPIVLREVVARLRGEDLGPAKAPYREYVRWLRAQDRDAARAHFRARTGGLARATLVPRDRAMLADAGSRSRDRRTLRRPLAAHTVEAVARLARDSGTTTSSVALAAYAILLARMTGDLRVVFGVTVHGRPDDLPGADGMVGVLIQTFPFVVDTGSEHEIRRWLPEVQLALARDQVHAHVGLAALREETPAAAFENLFVVENYPLEAPEGVNGLAFGAPRAARQIDLPLAFVIPPGGPAAELDFDPARIDDDDARDLLERFTQILEAIASAPGARVRDIHVLSSDERARALALASPPETTRADLDARPLHTRFLDVAAEVPAATAVTDGRASFTYAKLELAAVDLAARLQELGVEPGDKVALVADAGAKQIAGVLGILLAGAAFVPFDPSYPEARLIAMAKAAEPRAIVSTVGHLALARVVAPAIAPGTRAAPVVALDAPALFAVGLEPALPSRLAHDLAYVLFTSGSTGQPKGVMGHHAGVLALIDDLDARAPIPRGANTSQWTSPSFDVSIWETFAALTRGACLHVVPAAIRADARALVAWLDASRIASAYLPGFALGALAERLEEGGCRALRRLLVGVEPIKGALVDRLLARADDLVIVNGYGPTEASICATLHTVAPGDRRAQIVPIGRAVKGARTYVLDERMQPVPPRVPGEVFVAGIGIAHGYVGGSSDDARRFLADPFSSEGARMYRTGDRALALDDGSLVFLGRLDRQLKIRGVRVELGEVDAALARLPFVREGVALAVDVGGATSLVAAVVLEGGDRARVRAELRALLPEAMVPTRVAELLALPRDPNGKVDRARVRRLIDEAPIDAVVEELSPTADTLTRLVGDLVGARPRSDDDFLSAGGDSLSAMRLASRVRETFGVDLPLSWIFEAKSIGELAARVEEAALGRSPHAPPTALARSADPASGPPSFAQERLLFIDRLSPGSPVYNLACSARLRGPLEVGALRRALDEHVRRHGALRTVFDEQDGLFLQRVRAPSPVLGSGDVTDLRRHADPRSEAMARAAVDVRRPFDLKRGPLFRAHLYELGDDDHVVTLVLHHVIADGWSLGIVLSEVLALYEAFARGAPSPLAELPTQYIDFARAQRAGFDEARAAELVRRWTARLSGAPASIDLPTDFVRPEVQTFQGGHLRFTLAEGLVARLDALAERSHVTRAQLLLAALDALLMRWSGSTDVSVGVSLANRRQRDVEALVGFFVNVVVVRAELDDASAPFEALLAHVRERSLEAYDNQDLPFDRLVEELRPRRTLAHAPLFQVNFVYDDAVSTRPRGALDVSPLDVETGTSRFDLALSLLRDGARVTASLEYNSDVFERRTAERLARSFEHLLEAVAEHPETPIDALPLAAPDALPWARLDRGRAHDAALDPDRPADAALDPAPSFVGLFAAAAQRAPDAVALRSREAGVTTTVTYRELDRATVRHANFLRGAGVGRDVVVGVCAHRSIGAVVAIVAILRAGGAFLPLDPDVPLERLSVIADGARPALVLTTEAAADLVPASVANVLVLEDLAPLCEAEPTSIAPLPDATEDDLAYVIFTSGSTGAPNGVLVARRGLSNLARAQARAFGVEPQSRVLQFASLGFDASISEIATTLASGAALDLGAGADRSDVSEALRHVTIATLPPSLLAALDPAEYPDLVTVVSAGEPLPAPVARRWIGAGKQVINAYGPTEATVCATLGTVTLEDIDGDRAPSIGAPMAGCRVHVVDARHRPVPPGVVGELAIGGAGVARGYLDRPELTRDRFVADPTRPGERIYLTGDRARRREDGRVDFLGRTDGQVKVRGYRIEAGDVEACLRRHAGVADAAVVASAESRRLVAHVVAADPASPPSSDDLARFVASKLPAFMVPEGFVTIDALPLTPSGKVDRRSLSHASGSRPAASSAERPFVAPQNRVEAVLARALAGVLRRPEIGVDDNFFELGGDSITSIQAAARARREGVVFGVKDLFLKQTVRELATVALEADPADVVDVPAEGDVPLTPIQRWFFAQRSPEHAHYNQSIVLELELEPALRLASLREAAQAVVAAHDALRLRFERDVETTLDGAPAWVPWRQMYGSAEGSVIVEAAPLSELTATRRQAQRSLDLARGPVARVVLFEGRPARLLVVAHHLVIDAVSLRVLVSDLLTAHAQIAARRPPELPLKTASYKAWARALFDPALDLSAERRILEALGRGRVRLPADGAAPETDTRGAARTLVTELDEAETRRVEAALPGLGVSTSELLLAALGLTLAPALRGGAIVVDLEGHGRDALDREHPIDVTRTVGWFTSVAPVHLDTADAGDARAMLRSVSKAVAAIPRSGAGFGVLGYVGSGEIGLNYLGRVESALAPGVRLAPEQADDDQSPDTPRPSAIELQAMILRGRLRVAWTFAEARHAASTIDSWARGLMAGLRALVASAAATAPPVYTTGDFPEAGLTADELDAILSEVEGIDEP